MPIPDLLWACPACGTDRGLAPDADAFGCRACGTRFRRAHGAAIEAVGPDGSRVTRTPAQWVDRLPDPAALLDPGAAAGGGATPGRPDPPLPQGDAAHDPLRAARVSLRFVAGHGVVRGREGYLNRFERFGEAREGTLELQPDRLIFRGEGEPPVSWHFDRLRAVQTSSRSIQIRGGDRPLASFICLDDSIFLWEHLITAAVRRFYRRTGRGEILEFQPRIVVRR